RLRLERRRRQLPGCRQRICRPRLGRGRRKPDARGQLVVAGRGDREQLDVDGEPERSGAPRGGRLPRLGRRSRRRPLPVHLGLAGEPVRHGALSILRALAGPAAGSCSTGASGPWSTSISLPVAAGATTSASFYYTDNRSGSPTLTATAPGYTSSTQTETIRAASLAGITISPASSQVRVGA